MLFSAALGTVCFALARFLLGARLRQLASAIGEHAPTGAATAEIEAAYTRALRRQLGAAATGFSDQYRRASALVRILFIAGSLSALFATTVLVIYLFVAGVVDQMRTWAADTVVAGLYGFGALATDFGSNVVNTIPLCLIIAVAVWVVMYVFERMAIVWRIHFGRALGEEPVSPNRYQLAMTTIGVVFPAAMLALLVFVYQENGAMRDYRGNLRHGRDHVVKIFSGEDPVGDKLREEIGYKSGEPWSEELAIGVVIEEVVRGGSSPEALDPEVGGAAAKSISKELAEKMIRMDYLPPSSRLDDLKSLIEPDETGDGQN